MKLEPPKTLKDFQKAYKTIMELIDNPYCDYGMYVKMLGKLDEVNAKIRELEHKALTKKALRK